MVLVRKVASAAGGRRRRELFSRQTVTLTQGSQWAPYSRPGSSAQHSTAIASLATGLSGRREASREKVMVGQEGGDGETEVEERAGEVRPLDMEL